MDVVTDLLERRMICKAAEPALVGLTVEELEAKIAPGTAETVLPLDC